jgi:Helix-turn-helix domain
VVERSGRPWGQLKGDDPALHELARHLRGLVAHSGSTVKEIGRRCGCSDTTISKQLNGVHFPTWDMPCPMHDRVGCDYTQYHEYGSL